MKKTISLLAMSLGLMASASAQNAQGQVNEYYRQGVRQNDVAAYCTTQFTNLCEGTTFEITRDKTDRNGIRHITLRQYVDGVKSRSGILQVHMRQGAIKAIQGTVMTQEMMATAKSHRAPIRPTEALQRVGLPETLAENLTPELQMIGGVCHQVYVVNAGIYQYTIDAQTGEQLSKHSMLKNFAQDDENWLPGTVVEGTATTYHSGDRTMTFMQDPELGYYLGDASRNIMVLDVSGNQLIANGLPANKFSLLSYYPSEYCTFEDLLDCTGLFTNNSPEWTDTTFGVEIDNLIFCAESEQCLACGKYLYAVFAYDEENTYVTDTVQVVSHNTTLSFAEPIVGQLADYTVTFLTYDPETNTSEEYYAIEGSQQFNYQHYYFSEIDPEEIGPNDEEMQEQLEADVATNGYAFVGNRMVGYLPANDVLWGMEQVYDYYLNTFGCKSFDGEGTVIPCMVNFPEKIDDAYNAAALYIDPERGKSLMFFGMGGKSANPFVILQIMGHEFTHLVARNLNDVHEDSDDVYCGALNESFADIMGLAIDRYATGREYWDIGEGVFRNGRIVRSFKDPESYEGPSCYEGNYFDKEDFEPHCNSCVQSHMYYLLVEGGEGINTMGNDYYVAPMDRNEAEALAFSTLMDYTFSPMSYVQAAEAWYAAACLMFGENSPQTQSVMQAWAAVNLPLGDITGIDQICHDRQTTSRRYNLQGQLVGEGYRGMFIER